MTPKRECSGAVRRPVRVVAPTSVNGLMSSWMALGEGAVAHHHVDAKVLDRGVEALLDGRAQAVDLVDEEDVVRARAREQAGERALVLDGGAARHDELRAHLVGQDVRERRLAEAGRAAEEDVIERLAAAARGLDEDAQVLLVLLLADVLVERRRAEDAIEALVVVGRARAEPERAWRRCLGRLVARAALYARGSLALRPSLADV